MYKELEGGVFLKQDISYPTLMKKHIKKHSSYLQPIFEAISNSLEVTNGAKDSIDVRMNYSKTLSSDKLDFLSIDIIDTGEGFNEKNLKRLERLYDESKGQNNFGTGRIQYLHFFNNTDIYSVYEEGGKKKQRRIVLSLNFYDSHDSVIWVGNAIDVDIQTPTGTTLTFYYPLKEEDNKKYNELTPTQLKNEILIHYLSRFCLKKGDFQEFKIERYINEVHEIENDCFIKDKDIPEPDYTDKIDVHYSKVSTDGDAIIKLSRKEEFELKSYKLPVNIQRKNEVRLTSKYETADVSAIDFSYIQDSPKIGDGYLLFLISSSYLTNKDTDLRGQLPIYTKKEFVKNRNLFTNEEEILIDDIQENISESITKHYDALRMAKKKYDDNIEELAEMFSLDRKILNEVGYKTGESDQNILKKVYEYNAEISAKQDAGIKAIVDSLNDLNPGSKDFNRKLNEKVKKVTELVPQINRAELTKYIAKRKIILELMLITINKKLDCQQKTTEKRKIDNERFLHNILFSQHSQNPFDSNLWMINDDFIHFNGVSEKLLKDVKIDGETFIREDLSEEEENELKAFKRDRLGNRPDILLFPKEHKCIIIELKSTDADVSKFVSQVSQYAGLIRQYAKEKFEITMFYSYLIGEQFTLNEVQRANPFLKKAYYFDYLFCPSYPVSGGDTRREGEMYIEVVKYSTLLEKAISRNKIFTDKIV